jgi:hypothetical protein
LSSRHRALCAGQCALWHCAPQYRTAAQPLHLSLAWPAPQLPQASLEPTDGWK